MSFITLNLIIFLVQICYIQIEGLDDVIKDF